MEPGQYLMSMADYLALDALSSGICHSLLSQSPAHARYRQMNPYEATTAMDIGSIVHQILLEGSEDYIVIIDADDWRTKAAREAREIAREEGSIPVLKGAMDDIRAMVIAAKDFIMGSELAGIFDRGQPEQTLLWQEETIWCKARPDWLTDDRRILLHLKTTQGSAEPEAFIRNQLVTMGYDVAAAFYELGMRSLYGYQHPPVQSIFLVQESYPPYASSLIALAPGMQEIAQAKVQYALKMWSGCLTKGRWDSYPTQIIYAEPKGWQINQMADNALAWNDTELYERIMEISGGMK